MRQAKWITHEGVAKQFERIVVLLMYGIEVRRMDDAEVLRPVEGTEATGDFLFHFRHSDRAFTQIFYKR